MKAVTFVPNADQSSGLHAAKSGNQSKFNACPPLSPLHRLSTMARGTDRTRALVRPLVTQKT
jgi:hypothetical protein